MAAPPLITRPVPSSGEQIPVIGLGTWQTLDVGHDARRRAALEPVLATFVEQGGSLVDSSPMFGSITDTASGHEAVARLLESEPLDFVQINYSAGEREAEQRVLPAARDRCRRLQSLQRPVLACSGPPEGGPDHSSMRDTPR